MGEYRGNGPHIVDAKSSAADRLEDTHMIQLQHAIAALQTPLDGARDCDHWRTVLGSVSQANHGIERARPGMQGDDSRSAGQPALSVSHAARDLLVATTDITDAIASFVEPVQEP